VIAATSVPAGASALAPRVELVPVSWGMFRNQCYVVTDPRTGGAVAVDPAWEPLRIDGALRRERATLAAVLVTHAHPDHVHLAEALAREHDCPVLMGAREAEFYRFNCRQLRTIRPDDELVIGGLVVRCLWTPGHTCGGVCYWVGDNLFSGDTLFIEGCGACWGGGADPRAMFESLRRLRGLLPADTRIFPGHSFGQPAGLPLSEVLATNVYLQFRGVDEFVSFRMRRGQRNLFGFR
jgi:hydroxyacylglutathione hydrolase